VFSYADDKKNLDLSVVRMSLNKPCSLQIDKCEII
jgi:hypothetical protein